MSAAKYGAFFDCLIYHAFVLLGLGVGVWLGLRHGRLWAVGGGVAGAVVGGVTFVLLALASMGIQKLRAWLRRRPQ